MKIPDSFRLSEGLEGIERLLSQDRRVDRLLVSCEEFLEGIEGTSPTVKYHMAKKFANSLFYTKEDVEELSKKIPLHEDSDIDRESYLGFYLSALTNNVITERGKIILEPGIELSGLGTSLSKGIVIVKKGVEDWTGAWMTGGKLIIKGNAGDYTGNYMQDGVIIVKGNVGFTTGYMTEGGKIFFDGKIEIIPQSCKAIVYHQKNKIWPRN